jgi:hypothetical protein
MSGADDHQDMIERGEDTAWDSPAGAEELRRALEVEEKRSKEYFQGVINAGVTIEALQEKLRAVQVRALIFRQVLDDLKDQPWLPTLARTLILKALGAEEKPNG